MTASAGGCAAAALLGAALLPAGAGAAWNEPVGGVPFVAWSESDGTNNEIRVARLNAAGDDWEQPRSSIVVNGGGINQSDSRNAFSPRRVRP